MIYGSKTEIALVEAQSIGMNAKCGSLAGVSFVSYFLEDLRRSEQSWLAYFTAVTGNLRQKWGCGLHRDTRALRVV